MNTFRQNIQTAGLMILAGILYLIAAPQYAKICTELPVTSKTSYGQPGTSVMEIVSGVPAIIFCLAGVLGCVWGIVLAIQSFYERR